jgi:hypothetical protein
VLISTFGEGCHGKDFQTKQHQFYADAAFHLYRLSEWWIVGFHNCIIWKDIVTGTIIVIAMNLGEVSVFEVRHKKVARSREFRPLSRLWYKEAHQITKTGYPFDARKFLIGVFFPCEHRDR